MEITRKGKNGGGWEMCEGIFFLKKYKKEILD